MTTTKSAVVVGAGVVGLVTALECQKYFRSVTIVAEKFNDETTSDGAAGLFLPSRQFSAGHPHAKEWVRSSYEYYSKLLGQNNGIKPVSGYFMSRISPESVQNQYMESVANEYRPMTENELKEHPPGDWKYGTYMTTLVIECRYFLPWATSKFQQAGGKIIRAKISSFQDLLKFDNYDLIFNCSGLGAGKLCGDLQMVSISGQVYKVDAPFIDKFYFGEKDTYIIPNRNTVTVGGCRHYGSVREKICRHDAAAIWERAVELMPRLATEGRIIRQWVGNRPHRDGGVRVEAEVLSNGLKIVHNYGHGGYGVTTAPGTSLEAVEIAKELLRKSNL